MQNELDEEDARQLIDAGCTVVVEAANMPLTRAAEELLSDAGVSIAPGKAANAGGVAVSAFEMSQNRIGQIWTAERLDTDLKAIMKAIFARTRRDGERDGRIDYRRGADRAGFRRVANAIASFGLM